MGKTLQTICLLCSDLEKKGSTGSADAGGGKSSKKGKNHAASSSSSSCTTTQEGGAMAEDDTNPNLIKGPTLVVAPSSAMWQWYDEMIKSTKPNTLKVFMYHGSGRKQKESLTSLIGFQDYDVVVTTYPIIEYEYRLEFDRAKVG
jgi:SNF2 family DNA or RNA helicase